MSKPLAAAIYEEQLISPREGFPLWEPGPGSRQPAVEIADVGYVSSGGWIRLFNASKPFGDPSNYLGVPNGYQQLIVGEVQERAPLPAKVPIFSETVERRELETALIGAPGAPFQVGGGFSFKCSKEHGAVLILGDDAERRDTTRKQAFARFIVEQSTNWLTFANDIHERGITLDDLVLVTGCDKTASWACAAFSRESTEASICFSAGQAGILESNISMSWIWSNCSSVAMRSGPARPPTQQHTDPASIRDIGGGAVDATHMQATMSAMSESRPLIRDQCVFLRGYKVLERKTWRNRLKLSVKKDIYDGFDYFHKNKDRTHGPDSGSSRRLDFRSSQGTSGNFQGSSYGGEGSSAMHDVAHNLGGKHFEKQDVSSPSASDLLDSESSNSGSDDGLPLNQPKKSNHLDIILEYILQNSSAELALAHHDDLFYLLQLFGSTTDLAERIGDNSPKIFIENGVGMLEKTSYFVNPSLFVTMDDMGRMETTDLDVMKVGASPPHHPPPPTNSWPTSDSGIYGPLYPSSHAQWDTSGVTAKYMPYFSPPDHAYHPSTSSAPSPDLTRWQAPEGAAIHTYERLPSANKEVVDALLVKDSEKRVYRCSGTGCGKEFSSKEYARVHVHGKHLGENKLFRCVQCRTEFASEDSAKRHRDKATSKTFSCSHCFKVFARSDYRDLHQRKCTSR